MFSSSNVCLKKEGFGISEIYKHKEDSGVLSLRLNLQMNSTQECHVAVTGTNTRESYKKLQELENPLVCQDVECVSRQRVDYRQSVDLVPQQRRHCVVQTARQTKPHNYCQRVYYNVQMTDERKWADNL